MRPTSLCSALTITIFLLLCVLRPSFSQIVGCDRDGVTCATKETEVKGGVCSYYENGIGVVSFNSNITSDGPLTWTVVGGEDGNGPEGNPWSYRGFYLGSPPSVSFKDVTEYGACAIQLYNITRALQLPSGFSDYRSFGCHTVLGEVCAQNILAQARAELLRTLENNNTDHRGTSSPCSVVKERLYRTPLPDSCVLPFKSEQFYVGNTPTITNQSQSGEFTYPKQEGCTVTTGGPDYNLFSSNGDYLVGKHNSEQNKLYKSGTTPIFTLFYNEPWNDASTGPVAFLNEPEVHMSCLRTVSSAEQKSGSTRVQRSVGRWDMALFLFCTLLWTMVAV